MALTLKEIQQFEIGDFVVHVDHGVGKFGGLVRMPIQNTQRNPSAPSYQEMIKILYNGGGSIYVSIHSLYKVSKYKSQDNGEPPRLSTLGTGQWERLKERTKKHIKDIARDLIKLYAKRRREKGFAFSADSYLQHELEASFIYEDTPDQLKATLDVKQDMERARPMDRLVCGDVGFGKTEVAVRAAFKAACDGKQVAVLVPTTVLAYQHYRTFSSRLKDMPVRVDYLTRAKSAKQTTQVLKDLAEGKVDIIIGTHKLIGKTVKFKDLGLLIIDEEQKFGVSTKEKLRQMKSNVDTLTMSATPIPRTLQFSLVGARDLSVIQTPPPNRYPIQTEIHTFGAEIIADAINFEMSRNGQVYFVNNRISDLTHIAEMIHKYIPDARIAIGHGQMKPEELEKIVLDFSTNANLNDFPGVMAITAQTGDVNEPQEVWVDNLVIEEPAKVDGVKLTDLADGSLSGEVKVTGSLLHGDCQNTNGDWFRVDFDDFALLLAKLSADVSVLDLREVTLMNPYWDQIQEKCPGIVIRLKDGDIMGIVNIASEMLQPGNALSYDLFGRRIQHPAVGQLFIRNGKKMIER